MVVVEEAEAVVVETTTVKKTKVAVIMTASVSIAAVG